MHQTSPPSCRARGPSRRPWHRRTGADGEWIRGSKQPQQKAKTDRSIRQVGFGESVAEVVRENKRQREAALEAAGLEWDDDGFVFSPDLFGRDSFAPYSVTQVFRRIREDLEGKGVHLTSCGTSRRRWRHRRACV